MFISLGEAARRTGLSKATVQRAIKSGKLSAASVNSDGSYNIDPAELARVYELKPRDGFADPSMKQLETPTESGGLQVEIAVLRERLSAIGREREEAERRYQLAADQIEDFAPEAGQRGRGAPETNRPFDRPEAATAAGANAAATQGLPGFPASTDRLKPEPRAVSA
jgi:excisionase family DNA binding protein